MPRIKVSFTDDELDKLKAVATGKGVALAGLVSSTAVNRWLNKANNSNTPPNSSIQPLLDTGLIIKALEVLAYKVDNLSTETTRGTSRKIKPKHLRLGVLCGDRKIYSSIDLAPSEQTILDKTPIHIDHLMDRFKKVNYFYRKASLIKVGGLHGELFRGCLTHAEKVAKVTSNIDPDGQAWFPVDEDRVYWIPISAREFCLDRLSKDEGHRRDR